MSNNLPSHRRPASSRGPAPRSAHGGTRFKGGSPRAGSPARSTASGYGSHGSGGVRYRRVATRKRAHGAPAIIAALCALAVVAILAVFAFPAVSNLFDPASQSGVEPGKEVKVSIPEGTSGDGIASILAKAHVIDNPKEYYATVTKLGAEASLKPGEYLFTTAQDPESVVRQLMAGPNLEGNKLTVQEGLTVAQTAARVEETFGIAASDFVAQAKASNYVGEFPFLEGAYNDSLEGYLYPKTYTFSDTPTADEVIRAMLHQFEVETVSLDLSASPHGLNALQVVSMASLIERETAVEQERPVVASVIFNRLDAGMPLQIDAAIVYARGGGNGIVTYDDLKIDSPYNVYANKGLVPGPICSPSISSIRAVLEPAQTDYLYYVASAAGDGTHKFSSTYEQFEHDRQEYSESVK